MSRLRRIASMRRRTIDSIVNGRVDDGQMDESVSR